MKLTITAPTVGKVPAEALPTLVATKPPDAPLCGSVLVLIQFDVCEEIRLDQLRQILGARTADASFKHFAPGYVRFQRPPVEEVLEPLILESGERLQGEIKYFDYGVVSVVFELPFSGDWDKLVQLSSRWVWDTNFESLATRIVKQKLERMPLPRWSSLMTPPSGCRRTTSSSICARLPAPPPPPIFSPLKATASRKSSAAKTSRSPTANARKFFNPASPTIPTISP